MRIGIYNRWLTTLGGGERYSLSLATALLERGHEVVYCAPELVSEQRILEVLGLDVGGVKFVEISSVSQVIEKFSAQFDLFINASQNTYFVPRARLNIAVQFFPLSPVREVLPRLSSFLRLHWLLDVWIDGGEKGDEWSITDLGIVSVRLPKYVSSIDLMLYLRGGKEGAEVLVGENKVVVQRGERRRVVCHAVRDGDAVRVSLKVKRGRVYVEAIHIPGWQRRIVSVLGRLPWVKERVAHLAPLPLGREYWTVVTQEKLDVYHEVWAISDYTRRWVEKWWRKEGRVLYPPVDVGRLRVGEKRRWILHVGRFFEGGHNKKQLEMVRFFRDLIERGLEGWELHLAGMVGRQEKHQMYFQRVVQEAEGLPVVLHPNLSFEELRELYAQASVYWHATGLDESEYQHPERFEHFGIAVVEAMAAGAVPVVIKGGGMPEIVEQGVSGFLWRDRREWAEYTLQLVRDRALWQKMQRKALERARYFGEEAFRDRVWDLITGLVER